MEAMTARLVETLMERKYIGKAGKKLVDINLKVGWDLD